MSDVSYCKPKNMSELKEKITNMVEGDVVHFMAGNLSFSTVRLIFGNVKVAMPDRGYMSKKLGDTLVVCRYA